MKIGIKMGLFNRKQQGFVEEVEDLIRTWTDEDIFEALETRDQEDVFEFSEILALISKHYFKNDSDFNGRFSFIANSSLSGGRHPCSFLGCRDEKLRQLVSFASLYSDEVYINNPFEDIARKGPENLTEIDRQELSVGIKHFQHLKPLIEKGIVKYALSTTSLCEYHEKVMAEPLSRKIEDDEKKLYKFLHDYLLDKCSVCFNEHKDGLAFFEISGPENFIDHGKMFFYLSSEKLESHHYVKYLRSSNLPYKLSRKEISKEGILSLIIDPVLDDLANQRWHSTFYGTSCLCDNSTQIKLASKVNNPVFPANIDDFEQGMKHYLPTVYSQDLNRLLDLREREEEAFIVYRDKVSSMISDSKTLGKNEIIELFRDQIIPEINIIDKKIKNWQDNARETLREKVLFGAGALSIGLYSGLLPSDIGQVVAAVGGGSLVKALIDFNKTLKRKHQARTEDFYFLWQANR